MSYIAHYPLINNTNDIFGHSSLTLPSSSFISDGILGSCLHFVYGTNTNIKLYELQNRKCVSIAFWIKIDKATAFALFCDIFSFYTGSNVDLRLEISGKNTVDDTDIDVNLFNNGVWSGDGGLGTITFPRGEWHHLAYSISETKCVGYLDGVRKFATNKTNPGNLLTPDFHLGDNWSISFNMFDLQIYSHALSLKEVKKIYETCVLDYNFNNPLITYKNYYTGKQLNAAEMTVQYDVETDVFEEYGFSKATKFSATSNTANKMSYSYLCSTTLLTDNNFASTDRIGLSFYAYAPSDLDANIRITGEQGCSFTNVFCSSGRATTDPATVITSTTKDEVVYIHAEIKYTDISKFYIMFYFNSNWANTFTKSYVLIAGISIYKLNENENYIEPLGIIGSTPLLGHISDGSGWGNDSVNYNIHSPQLTADTNLGRYAYRAMNDGSCVYFPFPLNLANIQGTVEFWVKMYSSHAYQGVLGVSSFGGTGMWIALLTEGSTLRYYNGTYYRSDNTLLPNSKLPLNEWHHIAFVWKDKSGSWYFDGKFINTTTGSQTFFISESNKNLCHFGGYYPASGSLSWNTKFDGAISSLKFYARYLTDDEIYSHYLDGSRLQVDDRGAIFPASINEGYCENIKFRKNKNLIATTFTELQTQDMKIKMLDDGSVWARLFHHLPESGTNLFGSSENIKVRESGRYSLLYILNTDDYKNSDGNYEFLLEYPVEKPGQYNRWIQSSNPNTSTSVSGYTAIHIDWTTNSWGGLMLKNTTGGDTYLKGSTSTEWYYAIGCRNKWSSSIPGPGVAVSDVSLYIRIDNCNLYLKTEDNANNLKVYKKRINSSNFIERGN